MPNSVNHSVSYPTIRATSGSEELGISANPKNQLVSLLPGRDGIFQTLDLMAATVRGEIGPDFIGYQSAFIQSKAAEIETMFFGQPFVDAVFHYVQFSIVYVDHPLNQQVIQDAKTTIEKRSGDCVSQSVLVATLLASRGIPVCFVLQDINGQEYSHVYCEALVNRKLLALDTVAKNKAIGWRQPVSPTGFETTWLIF